MATEYGYRAPSGREVWVNAKGKSYTRSEAESHGSVAGYTLIAREVSEPRIVSIRA